jgi:hypothetical protein
MRFWASCQQPLPSRVTGPDDCTPLHVHHVENEWLYALEGEYHRGT